MAGAEGNCKWDAKLLRFWVFLKRKQAAGMDECDVSRLVQETRPTTSNEMGDKTEVGLAYAMRTKRPNKIVTLSISRIRDDSKRC